MTTESVARARAAFRQNRIPENYSGPLHLATVISFSLLVAAVSFAMLEDIKPAEWLTIPLTFLYSNIAEYLGHRGPMHNRTRFFAGIFQRHTVEHHSFFTDEAISFDSPRDYRAVLFPPILLVFFFGFFAVPVGAILYFLVSPNVCFLFVFTAILYYLMAFFFTNLTAFTVIVLVSRATGGQHEAASYRGLWKRAPFLAFAMTLALLSLAGVPPLSGFFGKFLILSSVMSKQLFVLGVIGALGVAVSFYFYLLWIRELFVTPPEPLLEDSTVDVDPYARVVLAVGIAAILLMGVWMGPFYRLAETAAQALTAL